MTATTAALSPFQALVRRTEERFKADTADHQLRVLHDDGLYRHLRFKAPGSSFYWFDVITWPGGLTIGGDIEWWTFRRDEDMFAFFRSNPDRPTWRISADYWAEKLVTGRDSAKEYDQELFKRNVREHIAAFAAELSDEDRADFLREIEHYVLDAESTPWEESARHAVDQFAWPAFSETPRFTFFETYEWSWHSYSHHFLWACHAIVWAIEQYDGHKSPGVVGAR
jgi:hypothetical protein